MSTAPLSIAVGPVRGAYLLVITHSAMTLTGIIAPRRLPLPPHSPNCNHCHDIDAQIVQYLPTALAVFDLLPVVPASLCQATAKLDEHELC
ncbi:hypothetical protein F5878DRAFT_602232 [Lentinula raphanica]|uniref:Uncharacterized protein n=1 Tax=Lentinula raphanica TaxID=153919 RepID=A0AA38PKK7_9AGAR|nr:hypothetical protein F5878DRAFT_602232 [Lentinula raphanica]